MAIAPLKLIVLFIAIVPRLRQLVAIACNLFRELFAIHFTFLVEIVDKAIALFVVVRQARNEE